MPYDTSPTETDPTTDQDRPDHRPRPTRPRRLLVSDRLGASSAANEFVKENAEVAKSLAGDWVTKPRSEEVRALAPREATVLRDGSDVRGVHRDDEADLHAVSAVCPHMGCLVEWNGGDRTRDCPCHGSRFDCDGSVIDGPVVGDLPTASDGD